MKGSGQPCVHGQVAQNANLPEGGLSLNSASPPPLQNLCNLWSVTLFKQTHQFDTNIMYTYAHTHIDEFYTHTHTHTHTHTRTHAHTTHTHQHRCCYCAKCLRRPEVAPSWRQRQAGAAERCPCELLSLRWALCSSPHALVCTSILLECGGSYTAGDRHAAASLHGAHHLYAGVTFKRALSSREGHRRDGVTRACKQLLCRNKD